MDRRPSAELLESTHTFPGIYKIKAIGSTENDFERRVLEAVRAELEAEHHLTHDTKTTPGGRHVSLSLTINVRDAEHVRTIYARIYDVEGLTMLF